MDEMLYNSLSRYYNTLGHTGYIPIGQTWKLLVLTFFRDFVYNDYRGLLGSDEYRLIERALDCLYGSTCLIPYPDYLKMGKLHLGEITEIAQRIKDIEDSEVLKLVHDLGSVDNSELETDVIVVAEDN